MLLTSSLSNTRTTGDADGHHLCDVVVVVVECFFFVLKIQFFTLFLGFVSFLGGTNKRARKQSRTNNIKIKKTKPQKQKMSSSSLSTSPIKNMQNDTDLSSDDQQYVMVEAPTETTTTVNEHVVNEPVNHSAPGAPAAVSSSTAVMKSPTAIIMKQKTKKKKKNKMTTITKSNHKKDRKPHRWRSGTVAIREIRHYQRSVDNVIPRAAFKRLIREIAMDVNPDTRWTSSAVNALQAAAEDKLIRALSDANTIAIHAGRLSIRNTDLKLAEYLSQPAR
jgi:histone H3/H4